MPPLSTRPAGLAPELVVRRPIFEYPDDFRLRWTPRFPELSAVANAVSMAMPYAEPLGVRAVRDALVLLTPELAARAELYARQEASHHAQHRRLNNLLIEQYRPISRLDRLLKYTYGWVAKRSLPTRTGFIAGFEVLAFCVAAWVAPRADLFFKDADPTAARLFLWHLGEEVEHRGIAHDVHYESGGSRLSYAVGLLLAFVLLGLGTALGTLTFLAGDRRLWNPVTHVRLLAWTFSFLWLAGPLCMLSLWRNPERFLVPSGVMAWADNPTI